VKLPRLIATEFIAAIQSRPTNMKMLKRLFQFSRRRLETGRKAEAAVHFHSAIDTHEFTRLLTSRRPGDLKILAQKLSLPAKVKI
jgi:hypothetical protein